MVKRQQLHKALAGEAAGHATPGYEPAAGVTANGMQVFTPTSFVTAVNNVVYALDNDTGHPNFVKRFDAITMVATAQCPGGMTGAVTRASIWLLPLTFLPTVIAAGEDIVAPSAHLVKGTARHRTP